MNRKARILLVVLAGMGGLLLLLLAMRHMGRGDVLELAGLGDGASVDVITVSYGGNAAVVSRSGGQWSFSPPDGALADPVAVAGLLEMFRDGITSDIHSDIGSDPGAFGLEGNEVIRLRAASGGSPILDIEIGAVQTFADRPSDTFVRLPGAASVFRVTGRDLRAPFAQGRYSLRSPRLFSFDARDVVGLEFLNPAAPNPRDRVVRLAVAPGARGLPGQEVLSRPWIALDPPGLRPGKIGSLASQVASATVDAWLESLPAGVVVDESSPAVVIRLAGGGSVRAAFSAARDGFAWVSSDSGFARIRSIHAALFSRTAASVSDPVLFPFGREEIVSVSVRDGDSSFTISRDDGNFAAVGVRGMELDRGAVENFLAEVSGLEAESVENAVDMAEKPEGLRDLRVVLSDGTSRIVRFGRPVASGLVPATIEGEPSVYFLNSAVARSATPSLDELRRRNLLAAGPDAVTRITISGPGGRRATLTPPEVAGDHWTLSSTDGRVMSSPAATGLAGAVMSMSVLKFLPDVPPGRVGPQVGAVEIRGRDFKVVVRVSAMDRDGGVVCAVSGDRLFERQAVVLPAAAVNGIMSVFGPQSE